MVAVYGPEAQVLNPHGDAAFAARANNIAGLQTASFAVNLDEPAFSALLKSAQMSPGLGQSTGTAGMTLVTRANSVEMAAMAYGTVAETIGAALPGAVTGTSAPAGQELMTATTDQGVFPQERAFAWPARWEPMAK
jgi:hypothetical protein